MGETQLDRVEKKVDRILGLLEGKEVSTSVVLDGKKVAGLTIGKLSDIPDDVLKRNKLGKYAI